MSQGFESTHSGFGLEHYIEHEFITRGVMVRSSIANGNNHDLFVQRILLTCAPYRSIYGCRSVSEFLFMDGPIQVRIECRRQDTAGSVDEKLPYLFLNAVGAMPERNIWLVIDGNGARPKAIEWLKRSCQAQKDKNIRVYSLIEARLAVKNLLLKGEL